MRKLLFPFIILLLLQINVQAGELDRLGITVLQNPSGTYTLGIDSDEPLWVIFEFNQSNAPPREDVKTGSWYVYAMQITVPISSGVDCEGQTTNADGVKRYWSSDSQGFWSSATEYKKNLRSILLGGKNEETIRRILQDGGSELYQPDLGESYTNRYCLRVYAWLTNDWGSSAIPSFWVLIMEGKNRRPASAFFNSLGINSLFYSSLILIPILSMLRRKHK